MDTIQQSLERARDLLAKMTVREKAQQLVGIMPTALLGPEGLEPMALEKFLGQGIGHLSGVGLFGDNGDPPGLARLVNTIQRYLVEHTRLGIPAIPHNEALNGFLAAGYRSFPTPIGLAATWDPAGVQEMADLIRRQMLSVGARQALSPVVDVARDARWGRVHETYGEDPYLVSAMAVAYVRGLQGSDLRTGVIATGKHFLAYAASEAGQNLAQVQLGPRELYDVYATPFEAAIQEAGLASVMNSYAEIDGVPVAGNRAVLTDLLRGRMGFEGTVVSDYMAVQWLDGRQHTASSTREAGILALSAGLDVELPGAVSYGAELADAVEAGQVSESLLDGAVERILTQKFELGLFDNPYVAEEPGPLVALALEGRELSQRLAAESVTLLENDGILPLDRSTRRIAVIGPHADSALSNFAGYSYPALLEMLRGLATGESRMAGVDAIFDMPAAARTAMAEAMAQVLAADPDQIARQQYGAESLAGAISALLPEAKVLVSRGTGVLDAEPKDIDAAVAAARDADVVVLALGGRAGWFGRGITEGEGSDTASIELPDCQVELARAVAATGTPAIGVLFMGRPYGMAGLQGSVHALLTDYYGGPEGSRALARALFGELNPGGRLPYTLPRSTGQVPIYHGQHWGSGYRREKTDPWDGYVDLAATPLYPFGHGLTYTTFEYRDLRLGAAEVDTAGTLEATITIRNTGDRTGSEVVQLYAADTAPGVVRPTQQLVGFVRIDLEAGGEAEVAFAVEIAQMGYSSVDGDFVIDPGVVQVSVGSSSTDLRASGHFSITGQRRSLIGHRSYLSRARVKVLRGVRS